MSNANDLTKTLDGLRPDYDREADEASDTSVNVTVSRDTHGSGSNSIEVKLPDCELMVLSANELVEGNDDQEEREDGWEEATALYHAVERIADLEAKREALEAQVAALRHCAQDSQGWDWLAAQDDAAERGVEHYDIDHMQVLHDVAFAEHPVTR